MEGFQTTRVTLIRQSLAPAEAVAELPTTAPHRPPSAPKKSPAVLAHFGEYELLSELGRGGMGVVYKARHTKLQRVVALKLILRGHWASRTDVQRLRGEAEAAAHLDHPNIVPIWEVGEYDGQHFLSMKMIDGGSLARRIGEFGLWSAARTRQAVRERQTLIARMVARVARAVHHAHQRGILHRDLKPGNILLDRQGLPYVTDFGLAKRLPLSTTSSTGFRGVPAPSPSSSLVGTPCYMAPEQAIGRRGLTTGVDIYSLGVILYELLTGRPPFNGNTPVETLWQVVHQDPERPRSFTTDIDRDLETICLKCLEKTPERRYGSADALAADLEHWCQGMPITARRVSRVERAWRWGRRNPVLACLLATLGSLLLVEALVSTAGLVRIQSTRSHVETALEKLRQDYQTELHDRERAQTQSYGASIGLAQRYLQERRPLAAFDLLQQCPPTLHNWEWHYLARQCAASPRLATLSTADGYPTAVERRTAVIDGKLIKLPRLGKPMEPLVLEGHTANVGSIAFTPDGQRLASVAGDGTVRVWHATTGQELLVFNVGASSVGAIGFSLDGHRLLLVHPVSRKVLQEWDGTPLGR
jgi:serine/threonine protein kinase